MEIHAKVLQEASLELNLANAANQLTTSDKQIATDRNIRLGGLRLKRISANAAISIGTHIIYKVVATNRTNKCFHHY